MTMQELLELRSLISIAHHVPGRMRLRLDPRLRDHPAAGELARIESNGSGVLSTRFNPMARSLVVEYDPGRIDPSVLESFLTTSETERAQILAESLAQVFGVTSLASVS